MTVDRKLVRIDKGTRNANRLRSTLLKGVAQLFQTPQPD